MEQAAPTEAFTDSVLDAATQLGTRLRAPSSAGGSAAELSSLLKALAAEGGRVLALGRAQAAVDYSSVRQLRDLSTVFDVSEYLGRAVLDALQQGRAVWEQQLSGSEIAGLLKWPVAALHAGAALMHVDVLPMHHLLMSEPVPSVEDRALALSKLHSAAAQLGLPYEVLEGIALEPGLAGLSTNKARRFNVYQAVAMALGVRGKGNRADLGSDLEEALRLLYPNPGGSAFKDSLASLRRACPARLPGCGTLSSALRERRTRTFTHFWPSPQYSPFWQMSGTGLSS
ncbi:maltooligosyl trehalose synthase [Micractinium conductrix]|uniref:Maltooligosyl trehalose synthase n=1 Tax=Micractinium conductrix TaxID=554055 RepID=A0A2P6VIN5_9CHLO|nr:maltooligosyl trehalose synthase [Micractinium conductrix]|eukprot:PSC73954.1 maltooligosyl trehalose synthase [Micractinium conductrix]